MNNDRGVAHVLGVILMAGFAITVAATVAVAGASMFADSQSQIETSQVESSFSSLAADASELEDGESVEFDLGTADGQLEVRENTGDLTIRHSDHGEIYSDSINSLEYTTEDGDTVAYQGGGVFRQHGSGSSVVSAPDFYYRDNALSFPIQTVNPDSEIHNTGTLSGELALEREERHYPDPDDPGKSNPLEGGTVFIEMDSDYCLGWEQYFDQQTRGQVVDGETCSENGEDTSEGEVQVELSVPFEIEEGLFSKAVQAGEIEDYDSSNNDEIEEGEINVDSANTLVDNKASQCEVDGGFSEYEITDGGLHCVDEISEPHEFNTEKAGEDIEVYVEGDIIGPNNDEIKTTGDHEVTFYLDGSLDMESNANANTVIGNKTNPEQTSIFVSEGGYVFSQDGNNAGQVYAMLYAPEATGHVQAANDQFTGALIVDKLTPQQDSAMDEFTQSENSEEFTFVDEGSGPEFYYLHVTERTVTASN